MNTQIKCLGVIFDLVPQASGGGYFSYLPDHKVQDLFDILASENPTYDSNDLRRTAAQVLQHVCPEYTFSLCKPGGTMPSRVSSGTRVVADAVEGTLTVDNTGYTLRTLQGAAAACDETRRKWKVIVAVGDVHKYVIGEILLKRREQNV